MRKDIISIFKNEDLSFTTETNLIQNRLFGCYIQPINKYFSFRITNNKPLYINTKSNHPYTIISSLKWKIKDYQKYIAVKKNLCEFWDQPPSYNYQCCLQVSETVCWRKLRCCYSLNMLQHWVERGAWFISAKWTIPEFPRNFSRNRLGLNNISETLSQTLRKLAT